MALVHNPLSTPLILDEEGRTIAAGEIAQALVTHEPAAGHLAAGRLVRVPETTPTDPPTKG